MIYNKETPTEWKSVAKPNFWVGYKPVLFWNRELDPATGIIEPEDAYLTFWKFVLTTEDNYVSTAGIWDFTEENMLAALEGNLERDFAIGFYENV